MGLPPSFSQVHYSLFSLPFLFKELSMDDPVLVEALAEADGILMGAPFESPLTADRLIELIEHVTDEELATLANTLSSESEEENEEQLRTAIGRTAQRVALAAILVHADTIEADQALAIQVTSDSVSRLMSMLLKDGGVTVKVAVA